MFTNIVAQNCSEYEREWSFMADGVDALIHAFASSQSPNRVFAYPVARLVCLLALSNRINVNCVHTTS